jgi:hypothetical protein
VVTSSASRTLIFCPLIPCPRQVSAAHNETLLFGNPQVLEDTPAAPLNDTAAVGAGVLESVVGDTPAASPAAPRKAAGDRRVNTGTSPPAKATRAAEAAHATRRETQAQRELTARLQTIIGQGAAHKKA